MYKQTLLILAGVMTLSANVFADSVPDISAADTNMACTYEVLGHTKGTFTYKAQWEPYSWTVKYSGNNNTSGEVPENHTCYFGEPCTAGNQGTLLTTDRVFGGWIVGCTKSNGENCLPRVSVIPAGGDLQNITNESDATITLTAIWNSCTCVNGTGAKNCVATGMTDNMCNFEWECSNGYYDSIQSATQVLGATYTAKCTKCPDGYNDGSDGSRASCNACYTNKTRECQQKQCSNPDPIGCYKAICESSCECNGGTYKQYVNDTCDGNGISIGQTTESCTKGVAELLAFDGYHVNGVESCPVDEYNIRYELNRGDFDETENIPTVYSINSGTIRIPTPKRSEYKFTAWCDDENLSQNCSAVQTIPRGSKGDKVYYAKWEFECKSGKWLHIGDERVCLYTEQTTHPSLKLDIKNKPHYANLSENSETPVHSGSDKKMHIQIGNAMYNVYDNSVIK